MTTKELDCIWADSMPAGEDGEIEVFCTHSHNEGGWCKVALGEGCEYQQEE